MATNARDQVLTGMFRRHLVIWPKPMTSELPVPSNLCLDHVAFGIARLDAEVEDSLEMFHE